MTNQEITEAELTQIRALGDFDLCMLISEVHDVGWPQARKILPFMAMATAAHGERRDEVRQ